MKNAEQLAKFYWEGSSVETLVAFVMANEGKDRDHATRRRTEAAATMLKLLGAESALTTARDEKKAAKEAKKAAKQAATGGAPVQIAGTPMPTPAQIQAAAATLSQGMGQGALAALQAAAAASGQLAQNSAPAAAAAPAAPPGPKTRRRPPHIRPFDDRSARFYWPDADRLTLEAFVGQHLDGALDPYTEKRYFAAVHLLGLDPVSAARGTG